MITIRFETEAISYLNGDISKKVKKKRNGGSKNLVSTKKQHKLAETVLREEISKTYKIPREIVFGSGSQRKENYPPHQNEAVSETSSFLTHSQQQQQYLRYSVKNDGSGSSKSNSANKKQFKGIFSRNQTYLSLPRVTKDAMKSINSRSQSKMKSGSKLTKSRKSISVKDLVRLPGFRQTMPSLYWRRDVGKESNKVSVIDPGSLNLKVINSNNQSFLVGRMMRLLGFQACSIL